MFTSIKTHGVLAMLFVAVISTLFVWPIIEKRMVTPTVSDVKTSIPAYENASTTDILIELPFPDAVVGKQFSVLGKARGYWFFEASFPVFLIGKDGNEIAQGIAVAQDEWMTTEFVPFRADLKVRDQHYIGLATLILKKDNPSGESERDASVSFPITVEY